jgi:phosphate-selective porin
MTLIAQWLGGSTIADDDPAMRWTFDAKFLLVAQAFGRQRVSARYDDFKVRQTSGANPLRLWREHGNAWTIGWSWAVRNHVELAAEWLRIDSFYSKRRVLGESPTAIEHSLQLALRLSL